MVMARRDLDQLFEIGQTICPGDFPPSERAIGSEAGRFPFRMTTICFVGPSAYTAVDSALTLFRDEFEAKIVERNLIPVSVGTGHDEH
jgi:NADH-quinone oxidoreductase subunit F